MQKFIPQRVTLDYQIIQNLIKKIKYVEIKKIVDTVNKQKRDITSISHTFALCGDKKDDNNDDLGGGSATRLVPSV